MIYVAPSNKGVVFDIRNDCLHLIMKIYAAVIWFMKVKPMFQLNIDLCKPIE